MYCVKKITEDMYWIGASDSRLELFENVSPIPKGVSYNSSVILDEKTVLLDTVDHSVCSQFLENLEHVLDGRTLDYIIVNHMEPDHCASLAEVVIRYPEVKFVGNAKTFTMMKQLSLIHISGGRTHGPCTCRCEIFLDHASYMGCYRDGCNVLWRQIFYLSVY